MTTFVLTLLTLVAFAANSVLGRLALEGGRIDPFSFTTVRLVSGALMLAVVVRLVGEKKDDSRSPASWRAALALFAYAAAFSWAYMSLGAGTGALVLFGGVQVTMLVAAFRDGERLTAGQWAGFGVAITGLVYLVSPGVTAPPLLGAVLMTLSGVAWGLYSLAGRGATSPTRITFQNFSRAAPLAVAASVVVGVANASQLQLATSGVTLAVVSGAVTSGLGYVVWYQTLPRLTTTRAAIVQLLVPVIATLGGVFFLGEQVTPRLMVATTMILGGVAAAILGKERRG